MGKIKFEQFIERNIEFGGFKLYARDAYDTAKNIEHILWQNAGWFRKPKPMVIDELKDKYRTLCPLMEVHHPGVIDKMLHPEIIRQLGFIVDSNNMISISR